MDYSFLMAIEEVDEEVSSQDFFIFKADWLNKAQNIEFSFSSFNILTYYGLSLDQLDYIRSNHYA